MPAWHRQIERSLMQLSDNTLTLLKRGLERCNTHTIDTLLEDIAAGRELLWQEENAVAVCHIREGKNLQCWLGAGDLEGMLALADKIERWAKFSKLERLEVSGRSGWERVFKRKGYEHYVTVMTKDIKA